MNNLLIALISFLVFFCGLAIERSLLKKRRKKLRIAVQVNGTRGKSETVRLVHGALRGNGYRVLGKTTGTVPLWILPDGRHEEIKRNGPANIQEQYKALREAERLDCDAVVVECMAIRPEMQLASGRIIDADLTIITNTYPDHIEEIGATEEETARVLALSIPAGKKCLAGSLSEKALEELGRKCERIGAELSAVNGSEIEIDELSFRPHPENLKLVNSFVKLFGLDSQKAIEGMRETKPDVGSFRYMRLPLESGTAIISNAFAANDMRSTLQLLEITRRDFSDREIVGFFNSRDDRPDRALVFEPLMRQFGRLIVRGPVPYRMGKQINHLKLKDIESLKALLKDGDIVFGFGNIRGLVNWLNGLEVVE